jgi:hypothetical protein
MYTHQYYCCRRVYMYSSRLSAIKRTATSINWHPDGPTKIAVSYSILSFQVTYTMCSNHIHSRACLHRGVPPSQENLQQPLSMTVMDDSGRFHACNPSCWAYVRSDLLTFACPVLEVCYRCEHRTQVTPVRRTICSHVTATDDATAALDDIVDTQFDHSLHMLALTCRVYHCCHLRDPRFAGGIISTCTCDATSNCVILAHDNDIPFHHQQLYSTSVTMIFCFTCLHAHSCRMQDPRFAGAANRMPVASLSRAHVMPPAIE